MNELLFPILTIFFSEVAPPTAYPNDYAFYAWHPEIPFTTRICDVPGQEQNAHLDRRCYIDVTPPECSKPDCGLPYEKTLVEPITNTVLVERKENSEIDALYREMRAKCGSKCTKKAKKKKGR